MGFLDKVKAQATQAAEKAQQGVAQGQAKLGEMQAKKQADALLRDLGAAYYAQQRAGGSAQALTDALAKLDAHAAEHGPVDTTATAPTPPPSVPPAGGPAAPTSAQGTAAPQPPSGSAPTSGNFNLDDL